MDIPRLIEGKTDRELMELALVWHYRLGILRTMRKAGRSKNPKRINRLIIEMAQRLSELSQAYVTRKQGKAGAYPPQDVPEQAWLIPRPNAPSMGGEARKKWGEGR